MLTRMRPAAALIALALVLAPASAAHAQLDGFVAIYYVDPLTGMVDIGACQGDAIFQPPFTALFFAEVYLELNGASAGGISGTEFYIQLRSGGDLADTGWNFTFTPVAGTVADGNFTNPRDTDGDTVLDTRRGNFAWSGVTGPNPEDGCQIGDGSRLKLGDLQANQSPVVSPIPNDTWIDVVQGDPPSSVAFPCPLVTLCNAPVFTAICVGDGGGFLINPVNSSCAFAVESANWSTIKSLYR